MDELLVSRVSSHVLPNIGVFRQITCISPRAQGGTPIRQYLLERVPRSKKCWKAMLYDNEHSFYQIYTITVHK